ncbi:alpha/beta hydrolase [Staphylococcus argenteus]|uniref:alpha/beta hydrolase n=1 Tax=Staphylococcus argenteus TaxID=985002 RepID=UPI0015C64B38|nr:alpha/beta hydrolase [Staphylococcus argenteus]MDR7649909.1 alpha/beta hydrolase [Staphylococcus argenteus]MDR7681918.1 alpha/beta hydrolase [Staphylococcus argenteus]
MKKIFVISTTLLAVAIIIGSIITVVFSQRQEQTYKLQQQQFVKKSIPTLFLHGYGGSATSEKFMVKQAEKRGVTKDVITAYVSKDGEVTFKGKISKNAVNPIVKIELENNKQGYLDKNAAWFKNVLTKLQSEYKFDKFNFVGHSMGNLTFAQYMMTYGNNKSLPQLNKQVNIAGTFNGVLNMNEDVNEISVDKDGKPSRMNQPYQQLRVLKDIYKGKDIEVLNIYGDLKDGTHSDGRVSNSSSKSLKYLLGNSPKSYRESKYEGESAQHSQLHENENVANELIDFLWKK